MKLLTSLKADEIQARFEQIEVDSVAQDSMLEKFLFHIIEIESVRNVEANIIKQEMLVLGGEAALNRHTISCSVEKTPILLAGTTKTYRRLIERIRPQVGELPRIADDLEELLF